MAADFVNQVFMDLLSEDGLVVLARCDVALGCHVHESLKVLHATRLFAWWFMKFCLHAVYTIAEVWDSTRLC